MGVFYAGMVGRNEFFYKIRWSEKSILPGSQNFMQIGSEMDALQEKNPKMDPKKRFFSKIPQDFYFLKQVPASSHQTGHFGPRQYIGTLILS